MNRSVITVKAKEPFIEWLKTLPGLSGVTTEAWNADGVAYLLPEIDDNNDDLESLLPLCYDMIFERELAAWRQDEKDWPAPRDLPTFLAWFEPELRSVVLDLVDAPLQDDES